MATSNPALTALGSPTAMINKPLTSVATSAAPPTPNQSLAKPPGSVITPALAIAKYNEATTGLDQTTNQMKTQQDLITQQVTQASLAADRARMEAENKAKADAELKIKQQEAAAKTKLAAAASGSLQTDPSTGVQYYESQPGKYTATNGQQYDPASGSYLSLDNQGRVVKTSATQGTQDSSEVASRKAEIADWETQSKNVQDTLSQIQAGTIPLSETEQAQLNSMRASFDKMIADQKLVDQNYGAGVTQLGIRSGRSRYAPDLNIGNIQTAINSGVSKIAELESKAVQALADMKQNMLDKKYKQVADAWNMFNESKKTKSAMISELDKYVREEADRITKANLDRQTQQKNELEIQKMQQEVIKTDLSNFSSNFINIDESGNVTTASPEEIQSFADLTGFSYGEVAKAVQDRAYELGKLSSEDRLREVNIVKAQNDLKLQGLSENEKEWSNAKQRGEFTGSLLEWISAKTEAETKGTTDKLVKIGGVDYIQKSDGTYALPIVPQATKEVSELKQQAYTSAKDLLDKFNKGQGTSIVGKSRIFTFGKAIPGTQAADFEVQFNNLKSLLSLDNVKLLKGQGQVSDAERRLLAEASAKLSLAQSEPEFKKALSDVIKGLSGAGNNPVSFDEWQTTQSPDVQKQIDTFMFDPDMGASLEERKANIFEYFNGSGKTNEQQSSLKGNYQVSLGSPLAKRLNNPGNLTYIGQEGAQKDPTGGRFAKFNSPEEGFSALVNDLEAKKSPGGNLGPNSTLKELINVYAPPTENDTNLYVRQIASELGISENTPISKIDTLKLAKAIARKESSTIIS